MKKLTKQEKGIRKLIAWQIKYERALKRAGKTFLDDLTEKGHLEILKAIQQMHEINDWLEVK